METELSSVEGQRVMQVLDETLNATRLISCVTPDLRSRSANITDVAGPEVTDLLLAHVDLLEEYEGALAKCGGEPKSNDMVDVTLRLQDSVRTLSRLPGRYPGLVDKLMVMAMDTDMQRVVTRGVHTLEGLKHITFQKLITSVEEENSRQNFISGIERKEQQKQKERKDLETRLTAEKESRQKEVKRLTDQRDKLQGAGPPQPTTQAWCCRCLTRWRCAQMRSRRSTRRMRRRLQSWRTARRSRRSSTRRSTTLRWRVWRRSARSSAQS